MFPPHPNESGRLRAIEHLGMMRSAGTDPVFDAICETARALFGTPYAFVSIVGANEQRFKGRCGLDYDGTDRDVSFCTHTILSDDAFVIEDAREDPRFRDNPLVVGEPNLRFYIGKALVAAPGIQIGSFCLADKEPRRPDPRFREQFERFVTIAQSHLNLLAAKAELSQCELMYKALTSHAADVIMRFDGEGRHRYVSAASRRLLGHTPDALVGIPLKEVLHPEDQDKARDAFDLLKRASKDTTSFECRYRRADGSWTWVEASVTLIQGVSEEKDLYVASLRDLNARKAREEKLQMLARTDPLTGLVNRACIDERLREAVARLARHGESFGVICLDLDRFKPVNDRLGHPAGDAVLIEVAARLKAVTRANDVVGRTGGDEFIIIQAQPYDLTRVEQLTTRILEAFDQPFTAGCQPVSVGVSIGGIFVADPRRSSGEIIAAGDRALYQAKKNGGGTAAVTRLMPAVAEGVRMVATLAAAG